MTPHMKTSTPELPAHTHSSRVARLALFPLALIGLLLFLGPASASASKQVIAYFGSENGSGSLGGEFMIPGDITVNTSGAGPADAGDIYVIDRLNTRIQRFAQDDNGTPADSYDDRYEFVSAWGADADSFPSGGSGYEICTAAADCKAAIESGGNGTVAGNGVLASPQGISVDQDTGQVYVSDSQDHRINVYAGDGAFLRSFGWDVVESGPDNAGTGYEICIGSNGDVCKVGVGGSGIGQMGSVGGIAISQPDGNSAGGTVFLGSPSNHRIDTFTLDGGSPSAFGSEADFGSSGPFHVAVDSRGIVYAERSSGGSESSQTITRYDSLNANGGGIDFLSPISIPPLITASGLQVNAGLEVDPDADGAGPDSDVLYALRVGYPANETVVQQFGPVNAPGLAAAPVAADDEHGAIVAFNYVTDLGLDAASGRLFVSTQNNIGGPYDGGGNGANRGVYVLDEAGGTPSASLDSLSDITSSGVTVHGTVNPNGPPNVGYRLEYSTDGSNWTSTPSVIVGTQESPQAVEAILDPPGTGLKPSTFYHVRISVTKVFNPPVITSEATFTTLPAAPEAETVGAPIRSATSAHFNGRLNPRGDATTYRFEYGSEGPCATSPCTATADLPAGSGNSIKAVSGLVTGLQPGTLYHYRVVADNGNPGSPVAGGDMTVRTRASAEQLSHGHFAGPPGSDRAWEQVNVPDTGGNPVSGAVAFSDDGNSAAYQIAGGNPLSDTGSIVTEFYGERTATGWQQKAIFPPRSELVGPTWFPSLGQSDLSSMVALNRESISGQETLWRFAPGESAFKLFEPTSSQKIANFYAAAEGAPVAAALLRGPGLDPAYPQAGSSNNLYDVSSGGDPQLVSIMPDGSVPSCGVSGSPLAAGLPDNFARRAEHRISADGSLVFFPSPGNDCSGQSQLYLRDLNAGQTKLLSGPLLSGPACGAVFLESTPGAVFFWTKSRLDPADTISSDGCNPTSEDGDVYRYDLGGDSLKCLTCVVLGLDADVSINPGNPGSGASSILPAEDGSRLYFRSPTPLVRGAAPEGTYRIDVQSGDLRYIGAGFVVGMQAPNGNAATPDASVVIFRSDDPSLNPLGGGTDNGGTEQYYRYDDNDRSLVCVSCPQDGSAPVAADLNQKLIELAFLSDEQGGANLTPISEDGAVFAFATPTALTGADQNTPGPGKEPRGGTDVYEWRDGRLLLVTDGLSNWPSDKSLPKVNAVSPSGHDVFFTAAAQYTVDALDDYFRLYDARIGGGFEFPKPPPPCPLEVCQGIPRGAPEEAATATASLIGTGNLKPRHRKKGKKRSHKKQKHIRRHHQHRTANDNRRAAR